MNLHNLIPEKMIEKAVHATGWLLQTVFAAALPDIYQTMPKQMVLVVLGFTPESINRLKYITPALVATVICYGKQYVSKVNISRANIGPLYQQQEFKCCTGS